MPVLSLLAPWEPSPTLVAVFAALALLYLRGARRLRVSAPRRIAFWIGFALFYAALHTRLDYYAEHQFFVHRLQHLVLHHLAPFVVMASYPGSVLHAGLPLRWRGALRRWSRRPGPRAVANVVLNPAVVALAFVVSVLVWLIPPVQFVAMIDWRIYRFMNWSVAISGLLYWQMLLDHRPSPPARARPGVRVLSPALTMTPQILAGALIAFTSRDLYPVFTLCGRAFADVSAAQDQTVGGLIMWVPAAVIEAVGALFALSRLMRLPVRQPAPPSSGARMPTRPQAARDVPANSREHPAARRMPRHAADHANAAATRNPYNRLAVRRKYNDNRSH